MGVCRSKENNAAGAKSDATTELVSIGTCAICLDEMVVANVENAGAGHKIVSYQDHDFVVMACGNGFHRNCISEHYGANPRGSRCPICRSRFVMLDSGDVSGYATHVAWRGAGSVSEALQEKLDNFISRKIVDGTL